MKPYLIQENVCNPIKHKSREVYPITSDVYDNIIEFMKSYDYNIFETEHYVIEDDNTEKIYDCENDTYDLITDDDGFIILDKSKNETKYWHKHLIG